MRDFNQPASGPIADDKVALALLHERGSDDDLLRKVTSDVAQRLMQLDVEGLVRSRHGMRGERRENWRNGHHNRE